jgi:hypothetical protein
MNFLIYYGIGLAFVTGVLIFIEMFTIYSDYLGIKTWSKADWIGGIIGILLLALVWPIVLVNHTVRILYYIIKKIRG